MLTESYADTKTTMSAWVTAAEWMLNKHGLCSRLFMYMRWVESTMRVQ